jgi:hypothetical protein
MPIGIGAGTAIAAGIGAGASVGTGIYAAKKQSGAQQQAATLQASAEDAQRKYLENKDRQDQINFERTQQLNRDQADRAERNQRYEFDTTNAMNRQQYDETEALNLDQYNREQTQQAPFYEQSAAKNRAMAYWLNLDQQHGATYIDRIPPPALSHAQAFGGGSGGGGSQGVPITPAITQKILDNYKALGLTPTGAGSGPTDSAYFAQQYAATGGSTPDNDSYWFGPNGRIAQEARQSGLAFNPSTTPTLGSVMGPPAPPYQTVAGQPAQYGGVYDPKTKTYVVPPTPRPHVNTLADVDAYMATR